MKQTSPEKSELVSANDLSQRLMRAGIRCHIGILQTVSEFAGRLLSSENPQQIIELLCLKVMKFLNCDVFLNYLIDPDRNSLVLTTYSGISGKAARAVKTMDLGATICGYAAHNKTMVIMEDISESNDTRMDVVRALGIQAYACTR
jgi:GAF domain-containing protein